MLFSYLKFEKIKLGKPRQPSQDQKIKFHKIMMDNRAETLYKGISKLLIPN